MEDATVEDEPEVEEAQRPANVQHLLSWAFIGKTCLKNNNISLLFILVRSFVSLVSQQWAIFFLISLGVAIFLYVSARQRKRDEKKNDKRSTPAKFNKRN